MLDINEVGDKLGGDLPLHPTARHTTNKRKAVHLCVTITQMR